MLELTVWENKKQIRHVKIDETELIEAMKVWLLSQGYINLDNTWEIDIESITR